MEDRPARFRGHCLALVLPDEPLLTSITDDTYDYLVVARHVAAGDGFTFDGLHPTNGYQPLWLFLLVPLEWWWFGLCCAVLWTARLEGGIVLLTALV